MNIKALVTLMKEATKVAKLERPTLLPKVITVEPKIVKTTYIKPWRSAWSNPQNVRFNTATSVELQGKPTQYFEMVKDAEPRNVSVHFKTTGRKGHSTITDAEKQLLFDELNRTIPEGSYVSTYGSLSPGGVHGLDRLAAENGYIKVGTRMVKDKAGNPLEIPIFEKPISRITAENAAKITPEQWTAAQDAAIARGDMVEAQRLRDLHADVTGYTTIGYHGSPYTFNIFEITNSSEDPFFHFATKQSVADTFGKSRKFRLKINPMRVEDQGIVWHPGNIAKDANISIPYRELRNWNSSLGELQDTNLSFIKKHFDNKDSFIYDNVVELGGDSFAIPSSRQAKLADAVTYDDLGQRIPLGERDNFNINDLRYILGLPLVSSIFLSNIVNKS